MSKRTFSKKNRTKLPSRSPTPQGPFKSKNCCKPQATEDQRTDDCDKTNGVKRLHAFPSIQSSSHPAIRPSLPGPPSDLHLRTPLAYSGSRLARTVVNGKWESLLTVSLRAPPLGSLALNGSRRSPSRRARHIPPAQCQGAPGHHPAAYHVSPRRAANPLRRGGGRYCELDTLAMVELRRALERLAHSPGPE